MPLVLAPRGAAAAPAVGVKPKGIPPLVVAAMTASAVAWNTAMSGTHHMNGQGDGGAFPHTGREHGHVVSHTADVTPAVAEASLSSASSHDQSELDAGTAGSHLAATSGFHQDDARLGSRRLQQLVPYSLLYHDGSE